MKKEIKLIPMIQYILEIDWLGTKEFCDKFNVPVPTWKGSVPLASYEMHVVGDIKGKMYVDYAKILNKELSEDLLLKKIGFIRVEDLRGAYPTFKNGKYEIINDVYGWWRSAYDSVDAKRVHRISDLLDLELTYTE